MNSALDDIAFLANSENRVAVFEMIVEAPRSRTEIDTHVDASRVTITRILDELEAREWITQTGQECAVTPLGAWVFDEFTGLVDEIAAETRLRDIIHLIPTDLLTFDIRCLRDAEIILLGGTDPTAVTRRILEFHRSGERLRAVARSAAPVFIENQWELTVNGDTRVELILTPEALDVIRDHPTSAQQLREMLDETNAHYFVYEDVQISVGIVNGAVGINLTDAEGTLKGGLVTEDETVHAWAVDLFERTRDKARPVDPDAIPM